MVKAPGVLLLGNHAPPYGGVPNHVGHLARHLAEQGWRVHVLSDTSDRKGSYDVGGYRVHAPASRDKLRNLTRWLPLRSTGHPLSGRHGSLRSRAADLARAGAAAHLVRRHDLQLLSSYHVLKPGMSAAYVSDSLGVPLVTTVFGEIYGEPELHRRRRADVDYVFRTSRRILSCSRHCAESAQQVLGLEHPVDVLYYGVDVDVFSPSVASANVAGRFGVRPTDAVVLYVARMVEEMGLGTLLDAVPAILSRETRAHVVIVGTRGPLTARALAVAAQHPGRVSVHVDVPDEVLPELYRLANVVAAPSANSRACLGLAIAEAMASGRPVVACNVGGTAEVLTPGITGRLVPPADPQALAEAVTAFLHDPGAAAAAGAAGRDECVRRFDVKETNRLCQTLFEEVLAETGHEPGIVRRGHNE